MKNESTKKSVALLCVGLILGGSVVTGCSLVTTNYEKYYNSLVAVLEYEDGSKIEITRKDLQQTYSAYGFNQYTQYNYSLEQTYEQALNYLVSQKLAVRDAEVKSRRLNGNDEVLTIKEKKYLYEKVFEALKENINSFTGSEEGDSSSELGSDQIERKIFERKCELRYDDETKEYSLMLPDSAKKDIEQHEFWSTVDRDVLRESDKSDMIEMLQDFAKENNVNKDGYSQYLSSLKNSEKKLNLSTKAEDVFGREIDRLYQIVYDSFMVDKYLDFMGSETTNNVIISSMLELYSSKVRADYSNYNGVNQVEDVKSKSGDIYYFDEGNNINWFYVTQILVKFDDAEQDLYNYYTSEISNIENGIESEFETKEDIEEKIDELYDNLSGIVRTKDENNIYTIDASIKAPNIKDLYEDIKKQIALGNSPIEKIEKFDDLLYVYNEDPGIMNSTYGYITGVDYTKATIDSENQKEKLPYTVYSNWVEEFNKAAIELYNHGDGEIGDISDLVRTSYGIHILMYAGEAKNIFSNINANFELQTEDILVLYNTRLNQATEKTYFDLLYEECVPSSSSIFRNLDLDRLKEETLKITYYNDIWKNLYE